MELNKDIDQFDIPLAKRIYLNKPNSTLLKKLLIFSPFALLIFSFAALRLIRNIDVGSISKLNFQAQINHDHRILGHLPYAEISKEKLVLIEPNIEVHNRYTRFSTKDERRSQKGWYIFGLLEWL